MPTKTLLINSKDRLSGSSSNFYYKLDGFLHNVEYVSVEDIQLYNTQYTINSNNNKLYWTDNTSATKTSTIPSQSYTLNELCIQISNNLNTDATSGSYLCSYNTSTLKVSVSSTTGNIGLTFGTNTTNSIAYTIGYEDVNGTPAAALTAPNMPNLNTKFYEIQCDLINDTTNNHLGNRNTLAILKNNKNFGELLNYDFNKSKNMKSYKKSVDRIKFVVYDDQNNEVELNNADWSIQINLNLK